jgi:DnaA regulatory inactivator Hda
VSAGYAQLPLAFDHRPALSGEDLLVAASNQAAVAWIDRWPDWPAPALVVFGPAGCGKTHLGQVFAHRSGARAITPQTLAREEPARLVHDAPACLIDDAEAALAHGLEEPLLHLYNTAAEAGRRLMLTARRAPSRWDVKLADLRSRLNAALAVEIGPPDDGLIAAVLVKLFADRQLKVDTDVVAFLLARMERSFEAARQMVAALDAAALAERRNITVPLARQVLARLASPPES